ncbi:NADH-quinone oxidoreductase subunit D [Thermosulfuriphilus ammonigenes]|uniref:NADH-quinone oxidoreductase subunit D n=1 Tax=Thermosulfuriphilus ammonigenes TaxID=1936021 RepID=A0A6G7PTA0_9BACT|nr:NADH-quinone oxidoreductase subunit D [Thermosulfuriphilus ammonigenes]MBA2849170.1 NADH:ubiquinone oxidoreductase subunit D [Thermosulfuriphilus ammonigenes]QIJ70786.1 NADH-quinone oxidoreductase subunit D [Thermosulfuriphilus ammonigenes]
MAIREKIVEFSPEHIVKINIGPSHPAMHGTLRVITKIDGELIIDAQPEIGYLHRGLEKLCENLNYHQIIPLTDRLNYVSAICNNVAYQMTVEKLLDIEVPERAQWLRVIFMELARIADHIVCLGILGVDIGAFTPFLYVFIEREKIYDIFEAYNGARLTNTFGRIGGLDQEPPENLEEMIRDLFKTLPRAIDEMDKLLTRNRIWMDRTIGVSAFTPEQAIEWGFTGPCLRACGVRRDLRKDEPYLTYPALEFEVPVGSHGDIYDRYIVRLEEMRQSIRIIDQCLRMMPKEGPIKAATPIKPAAKAKLPAGDVYFALESPNGELGFFIRSDGTERPARLHVRAPCYMIYQAFPELTRGGMVADLIAVLSSLNVIAGELDR